MESLLQKLKDKGVLTVADKLVHFIEESQDAELFHIDIYSLAAKFGADKKVLLELFIRGLHEGIFRMEWEYHCPFCGGIAEESLSIHEASGSNFCELCNVNFVNKLDDNIEVFFSIHPEVRAIPASFKDEYSKTVAKRVMNDKLFAWQTPAAIRGVDIVQNPLYRELMGNEVLLPDQSLELMKSTVLFTDIKGSTRMYTELGDSAAFHLVREHFKILFDVIKSFNGIPVKTIGDAVMGVFANQTEAVRASLEAQLQLTNFYKDKSGNEKIEVKIGLHTGPTIVVTLNGRLDYFGSTVNMASRIQSVAAPNEVVLSEILFENSENERIISAYAKAVKREKYNFKGMDGEYVVYHIDI